MTATWNAGDRARLATWLFIGANSVLFLMLFIAFVIFHNADASRNLNLSIGLVLTASILTGAFTARKAAIVSLALGIVFLGIQIADVRRLISHNITAASSPFDTAYFTLTGIHALSVVVGLIALGLFVAAKNRPGFHGERREAAQSALSLYWYFLAAVWVLIFAVAYLGGLV